VSVIYCGVSKTFQPFDQQAARNKVRNELGIQQPYMLYVGSLKPYKNICLLLKAFSLLLKRGVSHQLVILGDDKRWKDSLIRESSRLGIEHKTRFIPYVQSDLLPELYSGADLLVMPSRIEGFGLPVLEAMACGTPVVCSQAASLPEVGGDAVLYFDPSSPDDLAQKIECLIDSAALRMELRAKGLQRSKHFTWNKCVEQHLAVYQSILH
jgi:glycosyltransferase involved in cell wall biosynthesis